MTLIIAHRGASGWRPEHTAAAVRLGFALGADAVEPDLVPTKDGVLVVRHEPEISGTTDVADHSEFADRYRTLTVPAALRQPWDPAEPTGWFTTDFTWDELATLRARERLPEHRQHGTTFRDEPLLRLDDLLDLFEEEAELTGDFPVLVAEIKHAGLFKELGHDMAALLAEQLDGRVPADRLVIESFEIEVFADLVERGVDGTYVLLSTEPIEDLEGLPEYIDGVSYFKGHLLAEGGDELVAAAQDLDLLVFAWTARPENEFLEERFRGEGAPTEWGDWQGEFRALIDTGVDGVFADHPDLVAALLG